MCFLFLVLIRTSWIVSFISIHLWGKNQGHCFFSWSILKVAWNSSQNIMINLAPHKLTQLCWMLHVASVCTPCCRVIACYRLLRFPLKIKLLYCYCMLLRVVESCCPCKVWNRSNFWANNSQYFFCSVIAFTATSSKIFGGTHPPRWLSNLNLQSLMGCIL